jgi:hypothetical protein
MLEDVGRKPNLAVALRDSLVRVIYERHRQRSYHMAVLKLIALRSKLQFDA